MNAIGPLIKSIKTRLRPLTYTMLPLTIMDKNTKYEPSGVFKIHKLSLLKGKQVRESLKTWFCWPMQSIYKPLFKKKKYKKKSEGAGHPTLQSRAAR